jgi:uncharacterized cupredoxin-like copper-binding protein
MGATGAIVRRSLAAAVLIGASLVAGCAPASVRVEIVIRYSAFDPVEITVPHGVPVTFVLVNQDPIEHEWLVGDAAFHARHRAGTEPHHGERPDEVTLPPLATAETTLTFSQPGELAFICHVPGHEAYGMVGRLVVT